MVHQALQGVGVVVLTLVHADQTGRDVGAVVGDALHIVQHIKRLKEGICSIDTGVVFLDVLNNAERISDHCSNIAARLVGMSEGDDYDSHTLKSLMHHNPTKDYSLHYEQCCKEYLVPLEAMEA